MAERIQTFREFWPFYVGEHRNPLNRRLHFVGTTIMLACGVAALVTMQAWLVLLMPLSGYGFAWTGHFFVEKNRPATFQYPLWSLLADHVMYFKMWAGAMDAEVDKVAKVDRSLHAKATA
jgi:hypothetical protein